MPSTSGLVGARLPATIVLISVGVVEVVRLSERPPPVSLPVLFVMVTLVRVVGPTVRMPPPMEAWLPEIVLLVMSSLDRSEDRGVLAISMPPPNWAAWLPTMALRAIATPVSSLSARLRIPPPLVAERLLLIKLWSTVMTPPDALWIPPPPSPSPVD